MTVSEKDAKLWMDLLKTIASKPEKFLAILDDYTSNEDKFKLLQLYHIIETKNTPLQRNPGTIYEYTKGMNALSWCVTQDVQCTRKLLQGTTPAQKMKLLSANDNHGTNILNRIFNLMENKVTLIKDVLEVIFDGLHKDYIHKLIYCTSTMYNTVYNNLIKLIREVLDFKGNKAFSEYDQKYLIEILEGYLKNGGPNAPLETPAEVISEYVEPTIIIPNTEVVLKTKTEIESENPDPMPKSRRRSKIKS